MIHRTLSSLVTGVLLLLPAEPAVGLVWAGTGASFEPVFQVEPITGPVLTGKIRRLEQGRLFLDLTADEQSPKAKPGEKSVQELPLESLVKIVRSDLSVPFPTLGPQVLFPEGDRIGVVINSTSDTVLETRSQLIGDLAVPIDAFQGLLLSPPTEPSSLFPLLNLVRSAPRGTEIVWLTNGDQQKCSFLGLDATKLSIKSAGGETKLDRSGVLAIGFDPNVLNYPKPAGVFLELTFSDGSRLGVSSARIEKDLLRATTRFGATISVPLSEVAMARVLGGRISYLSDFAATDAAYLSYVGPVVPYKRDSNCENRPLRLRDRTYDRGLGTQSRTLLAYKLDAKISRFQALVGVDDSAGPLGSVVFRVITDGKIKFASQALSARDEPIKVDVDISGSKVLILSTDFAERGGVRDYADWVEARWIRAN